MKLEGYSLADGVGRANFLFSIYKKRVFFLPKWLHKACSIYSKSDLFREVVPPSLFYGHNCIEIRNGLFGEPLLYYRKGHFCNQFFTKFNDTECIVYDREPERSRVAR